MIIGAINNIFHMSRGEKKSEIQTYEEFDIKPILDVIREGKFRWLGHVMRREPPSMLHEVVIQSERGKTKRKA